MNMKRIATTLMVLLCVIAPAVFVSAQEQTPTDKKPAKNEAPEPRTKDGKKLLTALDLLKINAVSAPRISPDGSRVAYTVAETKMEKDKEWKMVTQVWAVPVSGGKARQYTRATKARLRRNGRLTGR
jgi:hypothetical protein